MELNREQIIKALECCTKGTCCSCPRFKKVPCQIPLMRDALTLINELTEKNAIQVVTAIELDKQVERLIEVAREIFEEIEDAHKECIHIDPFTNIGYLLQTKFEHKLDELKKKYTEMGNENKNIHTNKNRSQENF